MERGNMGRGVRGKIWILGWVLILQSLVGAAWAVTELPKLLQENVPLYDLADILDSEVIYRVLVAPGATNLQFSTAGGSGDCDIYARFGAHPTRDEYDGSSKGLTNAERILFAKPQQGVWFVMIHGYAAYKGVRLQAQFQRLANSAAIPELSPGPGDFTTAVKVTLRSPNSAARIYYTTDGSTPTLQSTRYRTALTLNTTTTIKTFAVLTNGKQSPVQEGTFNIEPLLPPIELQSGVPVFHRGGNLANMTFFKFHVQAGQSFLQITASGGTGRSGLYVAYDRLPGVTDWDYRNSGTRNFSQVQVNQPGEGDWYVGLRGLANFSDVSLVATATTDSPDLMVWADSLAPYITTETFLPADCSVVEGLVKAGTRRLLRFTTESRNVGFSSLVMGSPVNNPAFEYAPCHGHYHFKGFAAYSIRTADGTVVATGKKVSFCLEDVRRWDLKAPVASFYNCDNQGIQKGWADIYDSGLPGQWVDITNVPPGDYFLEVTINPEQILIEDNYQNNTARIAVKITAP